MKPDEELFFIHLLFHLKRVVIIQENPNSSVLYGIFHFFFSSCWLFFFKSSSSTMHRWRENYLIVIN